jgi:hypothetical protein
MRTFEAADPRVAFHRSGVPTNSARPRTRPCWRLSSKPATGTCVSTENRLGQIVECGGVDGHALASPVSYVTSRRGHSGSALSGNSRQNSRYRVRPALALLALALAACTQTPPVRYVSTYCLTHNQQLPAEPPKIKGQLTGQADKDVGIIAGSAIRLRAWGESLQTILEGCREPGASAPTRKAGD